MTARRTFVLTLAATAALGLGAPAYADEVVVGTETGTQVSVDGEKHICVGTDRQGHYCVYFWWPGE